MDRILDVLESSSIIDNFPEIENPFRTSMLPTMGLSNNVNPLPPMITGANPNVLAANQQLVPQLNNLPKPNNIKCCFRMGKNMSIEPKTIREQIISLYGHVTGLKKELNTIKNNHLKHIHEDVEKLGGKVDKIYWVLLAAVGTVALFALERLIQ
jgi:hypothetical protein